MSAQRPSRIWRFGDGVTTDDILPGRYAPFMVGEDAFHRHAFAFLRPEFAGQVRPGDVLVGGFNWGLGSSREYAARALVRLGVAGVVAGSFARIHHRNLVNLGVPTFVAPQRLDDLPDGAGAALDPERGLLTVEGRRIDLPRPPPFVRDILSEGSLIAYVRRHGRLPGAEENPTAPPDRGAARS